MAGPENIYKLKRVQATSGSEFLRQKIFLVQIVAQKNA